MLAELAQPYSLHWLCVRPCSQVPVPLATKEAVDDQAISAGVSADTAGAIEAAIEAAGSQVGTPAGAEVRLLAHMRVLPL